MLSVKQSGIEYQFLSLWYDSTWDWTQFSKAIGEHFNYYTNVFWQYYIIIFFRYSLYAGKFGNK